MSDIMYPVSFGKLMNHILSEYKLHKTIYNVEKLHYYKGEQQLSLFGNALENPVGPAAGPNTQLAQNIVASYVAGARFMELKTVQIMYGEELGIPRPCINSNDEAYNVEWSSEYRADKAAEEYIKAWFALKIIAKEFGFGDPDGFIFNMSVGYNLEGIKSPLVDGFINTLKSAANNEMFQSCKAWALENVDKFEHVDADFINAISDNICQSITLSTMHGCPASEIEDICSYLLSEKRVNLYLKCNPTLLGYDAVRELLDKTGFDYVQFDHHQFEVDLKFEDAVPMIQRLQAIGERENLQFGVKLSNTFPVSIHYEELPGEQMYMSGKSLFPLTICMAEKLADAFDGKLKISYSGGADRKNIKDIFAAGIWPITVCTPLLQGIGYNLFDGLASDVESVDYKTIEGLKLNIIQGLTARLGTDAIFSKTAAMRKKRDAKPGFQDATATDYKCRVTCGNCIRVCPNRTNELIQVGDTKLIIHIDESCNECGNCACNCVEPCQPYRDRITYFLDKERLDASNNQGFYVKGDVCGYRFKGIVAETKIVELPAELKEIVEIFCTTHPYYL